MKRYKFLEELSRLPFVQEIWLYGSRARKDNLERSDIDLAIIAPLASEADWRELLHVLENADTLLKIDCIRFDTLDDGSFKNNILKDKKVLYKKDACV